MSALLEAQPSGIDLTEFADLGKIPWEKRAIKIRQRFYGISDINWESALERDIELFGRIIRDILKLEQAVPGRPGPRPSLDVNAATRRINQLFGNDFTILPFPEALRILTGGRSIRYVAARVGLPKDTIHRVCSGKIEPDGYLMKTVAEAFDKHPSYFLEWRMLYITQAVMRRLEWSPETTIDLFRTLDGQRKRSA